MSDRLLAALGAVLLAPPGLAADGVILGGGIAADGEGGLSVSGLVDVGFGQRNSVTLIGGTSRGDTVLDSIETRTVSLGFTQRFPSFGYSLTAGSWGDPDRLESTDIELQVSFTPGRWRFGLEAERRDIELKFEVAPLFPGNPTRSFTASTDAQGFGASVQYEWPSRARLRVAGQRFDYDRDLNRLAVVDFVERISPITLTLAGALRDHAASVELEFERGQSLFGIDVTRDRLSIGALDVTGLTGRWLRPLGGSSDIEFSLGYSDSDAGDGASAGVFVYYFLN